MDIHGWIALGTLAAATTLFITRWLPFQITALAIPVVLYATGTLKDIDDALMGFGNHAVIAIASIMVIGGALRESGVATLVARGLQRAAGRHEIGLLVLLMLVAASMSVFINNAAVVAILLPVTMALARRADIPPSRLLMPMAIAAVMGGTVSEIGTAPNLLVADFYMKHVEEPGRGIGVFGFAPVGVLIVGVGIVAIALVGRLLLPSRKSLAASSEDLAARETVQEYGLSEKLFEMRVASVSQVAGQSLKTAAIRSRYGLVVIGVFRSSALKSRWLHASPDLVLEPEDHLFLVGAEEQAWAFAEAEDVQFGLASPDTIDRMMRRGTSLAEVTLSPHGDVRGRTLRQLQFRQRYDLGVVGFWRRNAPVTEGIDHLPLEVGDAFLVAGRPSRVRALADNPDYVVLTDPAHVEDVGRAPLAVAILLAALIPPVFLRFPLAMSALGGALAMVVSGCLSSAHVRRVIDWKVLALLVGTLPLGRALDQTHVTDLAADALGVVATHGGTFVFFAILYAVAALFASLTSNAAAAVIVAPVALAMAVKAHVEPRYALLAMAYGCSANFLLPFAQCNLLVMTPGGYRPRDYLRVGAIAFGAAGLTAVTALWVIGG